MNLISERLMGTEKSAISPVFDQNQNILRGCVIV
jgi:hypothetical protein